MVLTLHGINIKKTMPLKKQHEAVRDITKKNKIPFNRETLNEIHYRVIPKTHFINKSYRTKKINKNINLVFGELKKGSKYEGRGIIDTIKKTFQPRLDDYNNVSRHTIFKYGDMPIIKIQIYRTPLSGWINAAFNLISLGKWTELKKKYNYDKLFHLAMVCTVSTNEEQGTKNIIVEKLSTVNINTSYDTNDKTEIIDVPLQGKQLTVYEMLEQTRKRVGDKTFFDYSGFDNNCQAFIKMNLQTVGLYNDKVNNFVYQDISELVKDMNVSRPLTQKIMNAITTTGALFNKWTGGNIQKLNMTKNKHMKLLFNY